MSPSPEGSSRPRALALGLALGGALVIALSLVTWRWHIAGHKMRGIAQYFFARQDMWVLDAQAVALGGLALWAWAIARRPEGPPARSWPAIPHAIPLAIALAVLVAWAGRHVIFHGYSASRDELMVELAGAYLAQGRVGWPIPSEWFPFQRAIMPEFYSPYGADTHWTAIYLPVHAAIRALFVRLGDADLAAPITLGVGLLILWHLARKLLPGRADGVLVTMVMALTSAQLIATAMTPFAMTSHFTFNLAWLALVLRGDRLGHGLAAIVALLAAGLHQWHFPLLFIAPFILWMAANRRWGAALFHALVCLALMVVWARLWPMALTDLVGPPPPADLHRTNGIMDKLVSLVGRLDSWQPLLNNARLVSWNNPLLLPLAGLSTLAISWRTLPRAVPITLPLLLGALAGMGLALFQGYGWGFRYMHGQLGGLCLLAGLGWCAVTRDGWRIAARASGPTPAPMSAQDSASPSGSTLAIVPASAPARASGPAPTPQFGPTSAPAHRPSSGAGPAAVAEPGTASTPQLGAGFVPAQASSPMLASELASASTSLFEAGFVPEQASQPTLAPELATASAPATTQPLAAAPPQMSATARTPAAAMTLSMASPASLSEAISVSSFDAPGQMSTCASMPTPACPPDSMAAAPSISATAFAPPHPSATACGPGAMAPSMAGYAGCMPEADSSLASTDAGRMSTPLCAPKPACPPACEPAAMAPSMAAPAACMPEDAALSHTKPAPMPTPAAATAMSELGSAATSRPAAMCMVTLAPVPEAASALTPPLRPGSASTAGSGPMRLIAASALFALLSGAWLLSDTGNYVRGYARAMAAIRAADADVVLVDIRGGYYMSDLVRLDEGRLARPVVMALHKLSVAQLDQLCARHSVAIMDWTQFWPLGVERVSPVYQGSDQLQLRRDHLAAMDCGRPVVVSPTAPPA